MSVTILKTRAKDIDHGLTPKQTVALPLLLAGKSGVEIAKELGVTQNTVSMWLHHTPAFKQALIAETDTILDRGRRKLAATVVDAVDTLADTVRTGSGSANRTKAAQLVLDKAGLVGPSEGVVVAGLNPEVAALANLIHQRKAAETLDKVENSG